ncbi:hypothetical protein TARUN_2816 [Trichoderma arundinaceum]|uniref:Uncharacterized protein n=1 Tax=Trichoderma arundinaceum TaxID=490622 RepID=A0A395NV77_TRIAR|nr:hypothetical protein TARUN_2816 [Trichoderma arundinaceum]
MSQPTFQLWEFHYLEGCDMHHLVLIQRTSNECSLSNLRHNLRRVIASGDVVVHERVYTQQDVFNIQSSAMDIIRRFESTSDSVDLLVASGKLDVKMNEKAETVEQETEWFEGVFHDTKFPRWKELGGRVVSLFEGEYRPEE